METRTLLLNTAEHLARSAGYSGFSYADLARSAGISKPSVHHHFPTKADLAVQMMQDYSKRILALLEALDGPPAEDLVRFVDIYRDALGEGETLCLCVSFSASRDVLPQSVAAAASEFQNDVAGWLERRFMALPGHSNPKDAAWSALALVQGAQLIAHAARDPNEFDRATVQLRAQLVRKDET